MPSRLLLGCGAGTVGHALVELARERGERRLHVVTADPEQREFPRRGVAVTAADPADPDVLRRINEPIASVFVGTDSPSRNADIARAAREVFTDVPIVAYGGREPTDDERSRIGELADSVLEQGTTLRTHVNETVLGRAARRAQGLRTLLSGVDGTLGVLLHDNPDPDAIASGVALATLSEAVGTDAEACYFGSISHQENRALVNLLDLDLRELGDPTEVEEFDAVALVDHSLPGVNDQLPEETLIDVVIDHHPSPGPVEGRHVDVRSDVGSTSTMMVEYFTHLGVPIDESTATALLFGIRTDTDDFSRGLVPLDFEAAAEITPLADNGVLDQVERPTISSETLETLAEAIRNSRVRQRVCTTCIGRVRDRDALAQAADRLLDMEGVDATLVYGFRDATVYLSARARGTDLDIGETLREAFDQIGSAGGHAGMAGAQIPLGFLGEEAEDDEELLTNIVSEVIDERFFETLAARQRARARLPDGFDDWWDHVDAS
jgi:nanoRNase/pAp phosphatase (c-di-AMP/oligoRNAs hydrolase)